MAELSESDLWTQLRKLTPARIGLGRVGGSLPSKPLLEFELAHARARDAVHAELDSKKLLLELQENGFGEASVVRSQARDRSEYLVRPDFGRALDDDSRATLQLRARTLPVHNLVVVIADGLSAIAPARHAIPLLTELRSHLSVEDVTIAVATQARVALGDEIGELLGADAVVVLIGERPGLSAPDSLGLYLTWAPRVGCTDAQRNCISNVRPEGLTYPDAARRLGYLLSEARRLRLSGVALKDDSEVSDSAMPALRRAARASLP